MNGVPAVAVQAVSKLRAWQSTHQTLVPLLHQLPDHDLLISLNVCVHCCEIVFLSTIMALRSASTQLLGRAGLLPAAVCNAFHRCMSTSDKFSVEVCYLPET